MKVLVTGATGFTGSALVPLLLESGAQVRCLVRRSSNLDRLADQKTDIIYGDLDDFPSIQSAMAGTNFLINIASLGFGHAGNLVRAAIGAGVRRAVFLSTTAIFTQLNARSKAVRLAAEETVMQSGLEYTILRPTMIYGSSRDRNMCRLIRYLHRWPLFFMAGDGQGLQQPVYVGDVAAAVIQSLEGAQTRNKAYNIAGASALTFNQIVETICGQLNRRVYKVHIPIRPAISAISALERFGIRSPIKAEQVMRLQENKAFDYSDASRDFGYHPRPFAEGIRLELAEMRLV